MVKGLETGHDNIIIISSIFGVGGLIIIIICVILVAVIACINKKLIFKADFVIELEDKPKQLA